MADAVEDDAELPSLVKDNAEMMLAVVRVLTWKGMKEGQVGTDIVVDDACIMYRQSAPGQHSLTSQQVSTITNNLSRTGGDHTADISSIAHMKTYNRRNSLLDSF